MRRSVLFAALLGWCAVVPGCTTAPSNAVHFTVDMRPAVAAGWFDPSTETVGVRGAVEPLSWERTLPAMDADGDGRYETTVVFPDNAEVRVIDYKFKVDGTDNPNDGWEEGPNRNVGLGDGTVAVARVFGEPPAEREAAYAGTIRTHEAVPSEWLTHPRDLFVYLPPGYDDHSDRRYPVLYVHDGQNLFDPSSVGAEWEADETAERLLAAGAVEPLIIVGVGNTPARIAEYTPTQRTWRYELTRTGTRAPLTDTLSAFIGTYQVAGDPAQRLVIKRGGDQLTATLPGTQEAVPLVRTDEGAFLAERSGITLRPETDAEGRVLRFVATKPPQGGNGDAYGRFLVEELLPFIDRTYRTRGGPGHTGLGGSSLGGLITMYLGLEYPEVFGTLLVVSPAAWWDDEVIVKQVQALPQPTGQRIWLDMGTREGPGMLASARHLRDALAAKGWTEGHDLRYVEDEGAGHNERAWAHRFADMLRFAFPAAPDSL